MAGSGNQRSTPQKLGIACFEGYWSGDLEDRTSVLPTLELLERAGLVRFIHRTVGTKGHLFDELRRWTGKRFDRYPVAQLAVHGDPRSIWVGDDKISIDELGEQLEGRCPDRIVYFASCSTMKSAKAGPSAEQLEEFRDRTKASVVCGFTKYVDWMESSAFETLLFNALYNLRGTRRTSAPFKRLYKDYPDLVERVGFRTVPDWSGGGT